MTTHQEVIGYTTAQLIDAMGNAGIHCSLDRFRRLAIELQQRALANATLKEEKTPREFRLAPEGSGPCVKQTVTATVVAKNGDRYIGTNHCMNPQTVCPRAGMATGQGYELCKSVCQQESHAEVNAISLAKRANDSEGATLYLEGHTYVCDPCKAHINFAGIKDYVIGAPPEVTNGTD